MRKTIVIQRVEPGVCPYCGSDNVDYAPVPEAYLEDDLLHFPAKCNTCGRSFIETYRLEFDGHQVGVDGYTVDPGDEGIEVEVEDA